MPGNVRLKQVCRSTCYTADSNMIEEEQDRTRKEEREAETGIRACASNPLLSPEPDDHEALKDDHNKPEREINQRNRNADADKSPEETGKHLDLDLAPMDERGGEDVSSEQGYGSNVDDLENRRIRGMKQQRRGADYGQRHREVADGECSVNPTETSPQKKGYCYVCEG